MTSLPPRAPGDRKDPGAHFQNASRSDALTLSGPQFLALSRQLRATGKQIRAWKIVGTSQYLVKPRDILPVLDNRPRPAAQLAWDFDLPSPEVLPPRSDQARAAFTRLRSVLL